MKKNYFTKEIIDTLSHDPRVKYIDSNTIRFTLEFRQQLYDLIKPNFTVSNLRNALKELDFNVVLYSGCYRNLLEKFRIRRPCGATNKKVYEYDYSYTKPIDKTYDDFLLSSGKYKKGRVGITPTRELLEELYNNYHNIPVSEYLTSIGIDVSRLGYQRLYSIEHKLKFSTSETSNFNSDTVNYFKEHPYVKKITTKTIAFKENFFNEARYFKHLNINEILDIFEIGSNRLNYDRKNNLKFSINTYTQNQIEPIDTNIALLIKIEINKEKVLSEMFTNDIDAIKKNISNLSCDLRKELCKYIKTLSQDANAIYSLKELLNMFGLSKSSYYSILKNNDYGKGEASKNQHDLEDKAFIDEVINSNKYPKGNRMIYMLLKRNGHPMSRNKIYRLCRKFNIKCYVRKHNKSRQAMNELLARNVKDNLVKRKFKLSKPNMIVLTDVSYLKCDFGTVYLSSLKDACTGRVKLLVSKNNNIDLAIDTLKLLEKNSNGIKLFHSDQGALYLSDQFQTKLKELGYTQSMSKRGNCWDNSPQESFFGHAKDEIDFKNLNSFEDVVKEIKEYEHYYNYERPQWNRCMMTPVEFEAYINSLNETQYKKYYDKELDKYNQMMENARELAINRAKSIGITIDL